MKRQRMTIPVPRPVQGLRITDRHIRVRSARQELVLTFQDIHHVESFLAAFGEAWVRWDEEEDNSRHSLLDELQQPLPF